MAVIREPFGPPVSMRDAYGQALVALGKERADLIVLSADVSNSDRSGMFEAAYPERFVNVGIAEQALVDVAVGLARSGFVPVANTFAFLFATRALEMVRTHLAFGGANVKLAAAYAGISDSFDGPTHHAIDDLAILRSLPHMTIVVPAESVAVARLLPQVVDWPGPVYLRVCRNEVPTIFGDDYAPRLGQGLVLREGRDVALLGCGVMVALCLRAAEALAGQGISARVVELHTIKPLDEALIERCARETGALVTAEEHNILGGLGGAVAEVLAARAPAPLERVGMADRYAESGPYGPLMAKYGLTAEAIAAAALRAVERKAGRD
jgi:transketolase